MLILRRLLAILLLAFAPAPALAAQEQWGAPAPALPPLREQAAIRDAILAERLDTLVPRLMR
ncbi:MAG: Xaa-Pro aminopeptidase, partial [Sphingopyxis sp.]|nr:Xaa-Pro aminopeptidase [Sphingopyxis sp.]